MKTDTYVEFIQRWAKKAWDLESDFIGTMSGGIEPPKQMIDCVVVGNSTVEISYDYPETAGLSDVRYHTVNPHRVRHDEFIFTDDGQILMNGVSFPGVQYKNDDWTSEEAKQFEKEYAAAFEELELRTAEDFDEAISEARKKPENVSSVLKRTVDNLRKASEDAEAEKDIDEEIRLKNKKANKQVKKKPTSKVFDVANYTKSLQLASEAETGIKFNGEELAADNYDDRDNNPADVMAGWDDYNETIQDRAQQERNLQHLVDEKGYHTPEKHELAEELEHDNVIEK